MEELIFRKLQTLFCHFLQQNQNQQNFNMQKVDECVCI